MRYDTERLRNEIARRHMTATDFAKLAGISKFSVYRALKGSRRVRMSTLGKLAHALKLENPSELLEHPTQN